MIQIADPRTQKNAGNSVHGDEKKADSAAS